MLSRTDGRDTVDSGGTVEQWWIKRSGPPPTEGKMGGGASAGPSRETPPFDQANGGPESHHHIAPSLQCLESRPNP